MQMKRKSRDTLEPKFPKSKEKFSLFPPMDLDQGGQILGTTSLEICIPVLK